MLVKYTGGRSYYEVTLNRKSYSFTKENNHTLEISDQSVINYIFSLDNRSEFEVVVEKSKPDVQEESELVKEKILKKKRRSKKRS